MANRVLLGRASTARGGDTKYGLWISKPGQDVTTCTDDQLVFNTDKGATGDIKALFQLQMQILQRLQLFLLSLPIFQLEQQKL